ncbi:laccase iv [Xylogone sp. PMI_703]|nr:laccase iv [Xylogone sp. PMI_703]
MGRRLPVRILNTILIIFFSSLLFYYKTYFLEPIKSQLGHLNDSNESPDLAIRLHPEAHHTRAPKVITHQWNITRDFRYPDRVRKLVYLINDAFPGPTLEARPGDTIVIEVRNLLESEGVAFHFHGLHMRGANEMDGVVGVTQNAIPAGSSFTYEFRIDDTQTGTFWYHSHSALQRTDGLYGALVIHEPIQKGFSKSSKHQYEDDTLLMVGDWYHSPATKVLEGYDNHDSWGREPVPDSIVINGRGAYNCSMAVLSRPLECMTFPGPELLQRKKKSRVRVINTGSLAGIILSMPHKQMSLFQVDGGGEVKPSPYSSSIGILYPGERVDILLDWDVGPYDTESFLSITLDKENFAIGNKALASTHKFPITSRPPSLRIIKRGHSFRPTPFQGGEGHFHLSTASAPALTPKSMPAAADQIILVYTKMEVLARLGNVPRGFINRTTWAPQASPAKPLLELDRSEWDRNQLVPWVGLEDGLTGKWVDIIVNNLDEKGHPFHLHGYDFYILSSYQPQTRGWHVYNPFDSSTAPKGGSYNLMNPVRKDTVYIPAQGYVVLRIFADNPGIWFFHCHIMWHHATGMAMALEVGSESGRRMG